MRLASVLLLVACGTVAAACASVTGLDAYSTCSGSDCPDATAPHPIPEAGGPGPDTTGDDTSPTDDGGDDADATGADQVAPDDTGTDADGGTSEASEAAPVDAGDGGRPGGDAALIPCPDGGCPTSVATSFSACPFGSCNGSTTTACTTGGGCFCNTDGQCKSGKCVKVTGENDKSCGGNCTGTGSRDGFDCELASPGIPTPAGATSYLCPVGSGYGGTTRSCDPTHTNCYCTNDNQCPAGKCVPSANNNNCSGCTGTGTPDYRGCQSIAAIPNCPFYIGCPIGTSCSYPFCVCGSGSVCERRELHRRHRQQHRRPRVPAPSELDSVPERGRLVVHHEPHAGPDPELGAHGVCLRGRQQLLERQVREQEQPVHRHVHRQRRGRQPELPDGRVDRDGLGVLARQLQGSHLVDGHLHRRRCPVLVHLRRPVPGRDPLLQLGWMRVGRLHRHRHQQRVQLRALE